MWAILRTGLSRAPVPTCLHPIPLEPPQSLPIVFFAGKFDVVTIIKYCLKISILYFKRGECLILMKILTLHSQMDH